MHLLWYTPDAFACSPVTLYQDSTRIKSSAKAEQLLKERQYDSLIQFCKRELPKVLNKNQKDSIEIAWLSYYQFEAQYKQRDFLESLKSADLGIRYCSNIEEGLNQKGILYYKKAYAEKALAFIKRASKSMLEASRILSELKQPNHDYIIGAYNFLSQNAAYYGDLEDALRYLRLSENMYLQHKKELDLARTEPDGNYDRYEVILPYKNIYVLYKQGKTESDSLQIEHYIHRLDDLHQQPEFNDMYERVYYTSALNHVGDWYASRKSEALTTEADLKMAHQYLDKSIDLIENKGYPGNVTTFKYNKSKALIRSNQLEEADRLMSDLIQPLSEHDGRLPFFLAQKGLVKAKMKSRDTALVWFYKAIEKVHFGDDVLAKDYSNFKPNTNFGQTKLLLRIAEELSTYFGKDSQVQTRIAKLYTMALLQFENSYHSGKFNTTDNELLKAIVKGILTMKLKGFGQNSMDEYQLLNRSETIKNRLAWKRFNQNRYANNLPQLDSLQQRKLNLRSALVTAKHQENVKVEDSIQQLLKLTTAVANSKFPNLDMFSDAVFNVSTLQRQLAKDELVLKYVLLDDQIAIYTINNSTLKVELKPWTRNEKDLVRQFVKGVKRQNFDADLAAQIAQLLLPKLSTDIKHIIVEPDGELYQMPFEILKVNGQYLTENYNLSYTSNLGFIHPELKSTSETSELAIYVPNYKTPSTALNTRNTNVMLAGAEGEAKHIAALFPSKIYSGETLTKAEFVKTSKRAKLLHLAMHAEVNHKASGLSKLIFSPSQTEDDALYLDELYGLSLTADLAVLSACNTGVDYNSTNLSIESFQRAFTFAGVPATVASLWEVPDVATQEIMVNFYQNLKAGQDKSLALKNAKLSYKSNHANTKLEAPYYWAGFVVYGEDSAIVTASLSPYWYLFFFGLAVVLIYVVIAFKRRFIN